MDGASNKWTIAGLVLGLVLIIISRAFWRYLPQWVKKTWFGIAVIGKSAGVMALCIVFAALLRHGGPPLQPDKTWLAALTVLVIMFVGLSPLISARLAHGHPGSQPSVFVALAGLAAYPSILVIGLGALDTIRGSSLFPETCGGVRDLDYAWFVFDNLAKGALLDFLESFEIDFYACRPKPHDLYISSVKFLIRSSVSLLLLWVILRLNRFPLRGD